MNLQAEKIELIKLIADIQSEKVINKIKGILSPAKKTKDESEDSLTMSGMLVSETVLNKTWKDEKDEDWAQYLKD